MEISGMRIPLNEKESAAVDRLVAKHEGESLTITRQDPGESGPLLVHFEKGSYRVGETGRTTEVKE